MPYNGNVITSCTNRATVTGSGQNSEYVGGIVGYGQGFSLCANFADITSEGDNVGGLAGQLNPNSKSLGMSNCMNVGNVKESNMWVVWLVHAMLHKIPTITALAV